MKFLLKSLLLFSLIVVGKLVKEPAVADIAVKPAAPELPVHRVSFFSRQATLQGTVPSDDSQQWRQPAQVSNN